MSFHRPDRIKKAATPTHQKKDISDSIQAASTVVQGYLKDVLHRALRNTAKRSVTKQATFVAEDPRSPLSRAPRLTCQTHHYAFYYTHCPQKTYYIRFIATAQAKRDNRSVVRRNVISFFRLYKAIFLLKRILNTLGSLR